MSFIKVSHPSLRRLLLALLIASIAFGLRWQAAEYLAIDHDEDTYLNHALHYATSLRQGLSSGATQGNWRQVYKYDKNVEHPALSKLVYGIALLAVSPAEYLPLKDIPYKVPANQTSGALWIIAARRVAAVMGSLAVFALALLNPLAGLLLAVQTTEIKFTAEIYLEPLPNLFALLTLLAYDRWQRREFQPAPPRWNWLWLAFSAGALGITAAGKYIYCVVGLAILLDFALRLWQHRAERQRTLRRVGMLCAWGLAALAAFFIANPMIWIHTWERFSESVRFHIRYTTSDNVLGSGRAWWHPLYLLFRSIPTDYPWDASVFWLKIDPWISALGFLGLPLAWKQYRPVAIWWLVAMFFLLLWATKWDQYILIVLPAMCFQAALSLDWGVKQSLALLKRLFTGL
ncbi:MAG TPA: hypothetical protein VIO61_06775 [Anaerolineaceae bacterium]